MMDPLLQLNHVSVTFETNNGSLKAVRDVSFSLEKGETLAIVGESGSGKSVTAKSIVNLFSNSKNTSVSGEVFYDGKNILELTESEIQSIRGSEISYIMQDSLTALNPTMKIGNQVAEGMMKHMGLDKKTANKRALELIRLVGINNPEMRFNQYPHEFSGGMRQRIVIAIAIACNPKILIADEPTTALDVTVQAQILKLMKQLQNDIGTSAIFITHDMGVVASMADRVAVMYAGKIVEVGTVEEIFYDPRHPYTWGLLASMPSLEMDKKFELVSIPGTPPDLVNPPKGCAFAPRNPSALAIDFEEEPPNFQISETHFAKTWLLHENAPKVDPPERVKKRLRMMPNNFIKPVQVED